MSTITDKKITNGQRDAVWVQHQPNRLTGTPKQNQAVFDEYAELIREHFNEAMDAIDERISTNDSDIEQLKETDAGEAATSARESAASASESAQTTQDMLGRVISISNKIYTKSWDVEQEQDEFVFSAEGYTYNESDTYEVFVNGLKLSESEYTRNEDSVVLGSSISAGNTVEIIVTTNLKGKGIADTELNDDYTLTINYDDGTSMTTESIRGEKGEKGDKGDGVYDDTEVKTDIAVLESRVDSFTHLTEGSTTGDAELIDARIGYDGKTYSTAGDSVRGQANGLNDGIDTLLPLVKVKTLAMNSGGITRSNGNANLVDAGNSLHTSLTMCNKGDLIRIPSGYKYALFYYSVSDYIGNTYDSEGGWRLSSNKAVKIDNNGFVSVVLSKQDESSFTQQECYALNGTIVLYSSKAVSVSGIVFGAGHIDTADQTQAWGLHGNDYVFAERWVDQIPLTTARWRMEAQTKFYKGATFEVASGYRFYIFKYENGSVINGGWQTGKHTFEADTIARIIVNTVSGSTPYTEWDDLNNIVTIKNNHELLEFKSDISSIGESTKSLNKDMDDALVAGSGYNSYVSGGYANPLSKKNNLCFSVITDIHSSSSALARFIEYGNNKKQYLDFCACLGDSVAVQPSESTSWLDTEIAKSEIPFYYTVGNHDVADTGLSGITESDARTKYFSTITTKGWLNASNFIGNGKCSWSKDFADYKVRVISLYEYGNASTIASDAPSSYCRRWLDSDLLQWFADTLYSTPTGYSVIVMLHQMPYAPMTFVDTPFTVTESISYAHDHWDSLFLNTVDGNPIEDIVNAFKNSTSISKTYNSIAYYDLGKTASVSKNFSARSENGEFIAYLTGHTHASYVLKSQTYPDQMTIIVPTGSENIFQRKYGDMLFDANTRNKDNFYCVGIDTTLKQVNLMQIGGHMTTDFKERIIASINY